MALKLIQRLPLRGQARIQLFPPVGYSSITRVLRSWKVDGSLCAACVCTSAGRCRKIDFSGFVGDPPCFAIETAIGLKDYAPRLRLTLLHCPTDLNEQAFQQGLRRCSSSQEVVKLLHTVQIMSDTMAAAALQCVAHLEKDGHRLKDSTVLEKDAIRAIFSHLEQNSKQLTDDGLVSALLACTELFLDPCGTLIVRLVSESQERLERGLMSVGQLCSLGQAMLAIEGPGCVMLEQVMEQIMKHQPDQWSLADLTAVYRLLQGGVGKDGKYQQLLNAMHTHAASLTICMDPTDVSGVLSALVALNQNKAISLMIHLCRQAAQHVPHFTDEELTVVLTALMHFGHSDQCFVEALEKYVPMKAFTSNPETVTKVMQFFGQKNILSTPVFDAVAESFVYRADNYSTSQLSLQITAFGKLGYLPPNATAFFRKVENILHTRFYDFQPQMVVNLLHSCILVERFPVNFVSKVFNSYFIQQLLGTGMDKAILAQLTQLYMTVILECPFYEGPQLHNKYQVNCFLTRAEYLETLVDRQLYKSVKKGMLDLLGTHEYFGSRVQTPYRYTLDMELKLDEKGYVLRASHNGDIYKRIALCIDGQKRFTTKTRQLLGKEAIKQRHLRLLGYEVIQIPFYEFETLNSPDRVLEYLNQKIFPHSFRLSWQ